MLKHVIWDIDGTLLNTYKGLISAATYTLKHYGISASADVVEKIVRLPKLTQSFMEIVGMERRTAEEATDVFRLRYIEHDMYKAEPFQGVMEVLKVLQGKGIKQSVVSNKRQDCAEALCEHFGITAYCSPIIGADRYNSRSKKDNIEKCISNTAYDPSEIFYIGDVEADRAAAAEAGVAFLGVNYGFGFHGVSGYADRPEDIVNMLI